MKKPTFLEDIEKIVHNKINNNINLINLSDWNPSDKFIQALSKELPIEFVQNAISYIFSSEIDKKIKISVIEKLGFRDKSNLDISFFDTGSLSILNTIHLISSMNIKEIKLLDPSYFSIQAICDKYFIRCNHSMLNRIHSNFFLPDNFEEKILENSCIWITNPVYCTGTYFTSEFIQQINRIAKEKNLLLVIDESLSMPNRLISPLLKDVKKRISILSPHKALCTNGMKFSAILFPAEYSSEVDSWSDITSGCLSISALSAIYHYVSNSYDTYLSKFTTMLENNREIVYKLLKKYQIDYDVFSKSYLLSLYFSNIPYDFFDNINNIKAFIDSTGTYFIPNSRNYFPKSLGFSFRLNLCRFSTEYIYALERALIYLNSIC